MLSYELREQVINYLNNEISLSQLEEWYVPRLSYFLENPLSDDAEMVAAVEMALAEVGDGVIDEEEARSSLQETLDRFGNSVTALVSSAGYISSTVTSTSSQTQSRPPATIGLVISFARR